jgi:hypothetical protein
LIARGQEMAGHPPTIHPGSVLAIEILNFPIVIAGMPEHCVDARNLDVW